MARSGEPQLSVLCEAKRQQAHQGNVCTAQAVLGVMERLVERDHTAAIALKKICDACPVGDLTQKFNLTSEDEKKGGHAKLCPFEPVWKRWRTQWKQR